MPQMLKISDKQTKSKDADSHANALSTGPYTSFSMLYETELSKIRQLDYVRQLMPRTRNQIPQLMFYFRDT